MPKQPTVSVIATVFNEIESIDRLLDSLAAQSRPPDEIVIVDGGSTDGTLERLQAYAAAYDAEGPKGPALLVLHRPGANISEGRNRAIEAAVGPLIACTDAGVRLLEDWLETLTRPFSEGARVSSGFFVADPRSVFETALGAVTLPDVSEIDAAGFLPSSRSVAFEKDAWAEAGGYPEWLDYCEDLVFDFRLLAAAGPAAFVPEAAPRFRPRPDALIYLSSSISPLFMIPLAIGLASMLRKPARRLRLRSTSMSASGRMLAYAWLLPLRMLGDVAKMLGYPVGWIWRLKTRPPAWRPTPGAGRL
jgi:glycosyltransferase involved in cell wall biosynthesis